MCIAYAPPPAFTFAYMGAKTSLVSAHLISLGGPVHNNLYMFSLERPAPHATRQEQHSPAINI